MPRPSLSLRCTDYYVSQRTLNPRLRGSSPWRRTRTDLGLSTCCSMFCSRVRDVLVNGAFEAPHALSEIRQVSIHPVTLREHVRRRDLPGLVTHFRRQLPSRGYACRLPRLRSVTSRWRTRLADGVACSREPSDSRSESAGSPLLPRGALVIFQRCEAHAQRARCTAGSAGHGAMTRSPAGFPPPPCDG
jgi:hypothetical protein